MSVSDIIQIVSIVCTSLLSVIAIIISVLTLRKSSKAIIESSRANIIFYIDTLTGNQQFLTIKNFGNSIGKLIFIDISPKPDYTKSPKLSGKPNPVLIDYSNIVLAPNQCIKSWFPFSQYPDKKFKIHIEYETLGKIYKEDYPIDISYIEAIDYLHKYPHDVSDEKAALVDISNNIKRFSEKF